MEFHAGSEASRHTRAFLDALAQGGGPALETLPAFVFVHGSGGILGDFPTHERFVRDLVADSGAVAVFVNYTPSPEARLR